ncbi:MAG TPA: thiamine pyrophosphate-binding protein, partial [Longimicrobiales bacterium]|nr:thiamine pyrophosphate-binding protein [Longimicrobiales bacterium]
MTTNADSAAPPSADGILDVLVAEGVTHIVGVPDSISAPLLDRLASRGIRLVRVTREGEAFGIASGLWLGGARPVVVLQNTGLLESGDALRGTALRMGVPLVALITCRGYARLKAAGGGPSADGPSADAFRARARDTLVHPELDTAALFTEPTLSAWGVPF